MDGLNPNEDAVDVTDAATRARAWADRMHAKKAANKARIAAHQQGHSFGDLGEDSPDYWSVDTLYAESERVANEEHRSARWDSVNDLLAVLGVPPTASPDEVNAAYKALVKEHHPDRHVHAPADEQDRHAEVMRRTNQAHRRLRESGRA